MPAPITLLPAGRSLCVDAFRGLTFVLMLFVNVLAGASGIPPGIHHVAAEVDGMGLADVVFPAFLFAVGLSIPFALNGRLLKGDSWLEVQGHLAWRAGALIIMGVFMVNMESAYNEAAMGMPIAAWSLLFYAAVALVWGVFRFDGSPLEPALRLAGGALLVLLAALYRAGPDGTAWMTTQWWGILGCIGWAYLAGGVLYQLARGRQVRVAAAIGLCVAVFVLSARFDVLHVTAMHATHSTIVLAGVLCTLLLFDRAHAHTAAMRVRHGLALALLLALAGWLLHQWYPVSKIGGTPSWSLYCAGICATALTLLYWMTEIGQQRRWTALVQPAAASPLVTYLIPFVLGAVMVLAGWSWPAAWLQGPGALAFALVFSCTVVALVALLNSRNLKLKL